MKNAKSQIAYFSNKKRDDDLRTSPRLRISRLPRILAPVNFHRFASRSSKTRDDKWQNQNLLIFIRLCCAQERKVEFYLGNTQKKVYCKPRLKLPLTAQTRLSREVSQMENRTRRSRTRLQTARDFDWPL